MKVYYVEKGHTGSILSIDKNIELDIKILRMLKNPVEEMERIKNFVSEKVGFEAEIKFDCFYVFKNYNTYPYYLYANTLTKMYYNGQIPNLDLEKVNCSFFLPDWDSRLGQQMLLEKNL